MSRILIIEDQPEIRRLIRLALKPGKHDVREASDGQTGLDALREFQPELVLLDIRMPGGMDGFEVCKRIRSDSETSGIPVMFLSADAFENDRETATSVGGTSFVAKPFSPLELARAVEAQLRTA